MKRQRLGDIETDTAHAASVNGWLLIFLRGEREREREREKIQNEETEIPSVAASGAHA